MATKSTATLAFLLSLNLFFFAIVSGCGTCTPKPKSPPPPCPPPPKTPSTPKTPPAPKTPTVPKTPPAPTTPTPTVPKTPPAPTTPTPTVPKTPPAPTTPTIPKQTCPIDALKLGVCGNLLGGLIGVVIGSPPVKPCCSLIQGLADVEAAICLCTALKANVLGINLNIPISLSLLLNVCSKDLPKGFQCG